MEHKKFQFKGTKTKQEVKVEPKLEAPAQPDMAALLGQLIDKKLAELVKTASPAPAPVQDKDFDLIEEALTKEPVQVEVPKAKLPKPVKEKAKLEAKKLVIENAEERAQFEEAVIDFNTARSEKNEALKRENEGRQLIVATMNGNLIYDGDKVGINIKEIASKSVSAESVFKALIDPESTDLEEIKAGLQQLMDLARLGVIEIGKTNFERWVKGHGYDPEPFMVKHEPDRRIYITPK